MHISDHSFKHPIALHTMGSECADMPSSIGKISGSIVTIIKIPNGERFSILDLKIEPN